MWLPKKHIAFWAVLAAGLAGVIRAEAGLYGFSEVNPYSREEELLDMEVPPRHIVNYRKEMRDNLLMLIDYARARKPDFQIMAHEGIYLLDKSLWEFHLDGYNAARQDKAGAYDPSFLVSPRELPAVSQPGAKTPAGRYLHSLDGIMLNNLYCGDRQVPQIVAKNKIPVLAAAQCPNDQAMDQAIIRSIKDRRPLYAFTDPDYALIELDHQPLINESAKNILKIGDAANIVLLTDDRQYRRKEQLVHDLAKASYDIIVMKPLFHRSQPFEADEIRRLQFKRNGARRLVLAEINVSEANPYDYYWRKRWEIGRPEWLARPSTVDQHSVITQYWAPEWRRILSRHMKGVVDSGFDGVFFTGLENNRYFEKQTPLI